MMHRLKKFKLFGKELGFTSIFDRMNTITIGAKYFENGKMTKDTTEHWKSICLGFYIRDGGNG